jgi:hypothetical protein
VSSNAGISLPFSKILVSVGVPYSPGGVITLLTLGPEVLLLKPNTGPSV